MEAIIAQPSRRDQLVASASLANLARALAKNGPDSNEVKIRLPKSKTHITIPRKALELLQFILSSLAQGKAVSLISFDSELTTQQAADLLNVSRPHLVKLLDQGGLPFKKVGPHCRVRLADLLAYEEKQTKLREHQLQFLADQAQDLHLGYE